MTAMLKGEFWLTAGGTGDADVEEEEEEEEEEKEEEKVRSRGDVGETGEAMGEVGETTSWREDLW